MKTLKEETNRTIEEQRNRNTELEGDKQMLGESIALLKSWGVRYILVGARNYGEAWPQVEKGLSVALGLRYVLTMDDLPIYEGDRLLHLLLGTERAFIVDRIHVYEVL